jgi:hypothetical protein
MLSKNYPKPTMVIGLGEMEKRRLSHICVALYVRYTRHEEGIALCLEWAHLLVVLTSGWLFANVYTDLLCFPSIL